MRTAEAAFASLTDEQRAIAQRVFGRLVRIGRDEEGGGLSADPRRDWRLQRRGTIGHRAAGETGRAIGVDAGSA